MTEVLIRDEPRSHGCPGRDGSPVLVVGASGYAGGHLCRALRGAGVRTVATSRGGGPGAAVLDPLVDDPRRTAGLLHRLGARTVVNAAGCVWAHDPGAMAAANVELVERLLAAMRHLGAPVRLVQLGTVHEYGAGTSGHPIAEDDHPQPVTEYGRTKLRGSEAVVRAVRSEGVDATVLRVSNSIGAGMPAESLLGGVAARLRDSIARGEGSIEVDLPVLAVRRDFVDMDDVADAVAAAAAAAEVPATVNIGSGRAVGVRDVVDRLLELSGLAVRVAEHSSGRADVSDQCLDVSRAARTLQWTPRRGLDTSLRALLGFAP